MTEQYPFFREADERTQAVIGEEAIASDLNGTYQKPYAVLTQKRLYCKNERGNFITEAGQLLGAGKLKRGVTLSFLLWIAFALEIFGILKKALPWIQAINGFSEMTDISFSELLNIKDMWGLFNANFQLYVEEFFPTIISCGIGAICLLLFLLLQIKRSKAAPIMLCVFPGCIIIYTIFRIICYLFGPINILHFDVKDFLCDIIPIILVVAYCIVGANRNGDERFEIRHTTGTFTFPPKQYPAGELKNFETKVKALKAGVGNGK